MAFCLCFVTGNKINAQQTDSMGKSSPAKQNDLLGAILTSVRRTNIDSSLQQGLLISKNEVPFLPYEGKIVRRILVREFGFEKTFADTAKEIRYFGKNFSKAFHRNTKERVIRNNLFITKMKPLNANLVADNERHLRSLHYIHDARIVVHPIAGEPDSVDLEVITKDFLSITAEINDLQKDRFKTKIGDENLLGAAQKLQLKLLFEKDRSPDFGYEILYRKYSVGKTFVNASLGFSTISPDLNNGTLNEQAWHIALERPLVSQYLHMAGGIMVAQRNTLNQYEKPDSLYYNYHYNNFDVWVGYNLGVSRFLFLKKIVARQFISLRYFRNNFKEVPYQVAGKFNFRFNDREAVLAQFTFFRQKFYKTNYVFGFGITEDVPYGYNIAFTSGWYRQLQLKRPYAGLDANLYVVTGRGNVIQYFLRTGTFLNKGKIQDAAVLAGSSAFSRVVSFKHFKIRQYLRVSYTKQFNRLGLDPLTINNVFGLRYLSFDSATGNQRSSLHTETIFFLKHKIIGFKFAPFASADIAFFKPEHKNSTHSGFYYGLGGGLRMRNEHLLFGTIEVRFMYFPRKSVQHDGFRITFLTNLRFRYNNNYVKAPDIIQVNSDINNNIF